MEKFKDIFTRIVNWFRSDHQIRQVRGRWCSVKKIRPTVYRVSVIDTAGNYVGARFITPILWFDREVDRAVYSLLLSRATY